MKNKMINFILIITILAFSLCFGSFLNVLILRIPLNQEFVKTPSHCMSCGHKLSWYDNIPLISWLSLKGHCRYCKAKISVQYPLIEALNASIWLLIYFLCGFSVLSVLYAFMASALIALSVIDFRTHEIPDGFQVFILILGIIGTIVDYKNWALHLIGLVAVSVPLLLLYVFSKGAAIGGGDVKLMAVCGLLIGWKNIIFAFVIGCVLGSIIHIILMKIKKADRVLAFGPYLSGGIVIVLLFCQSLINSYFSVF